MIAFSPLSLFLSPYTQKQWKVSYSKGPNNIEGLSNRGSSQTRKKNNRRVKAVGRGLGFFRMLGTYESSLQY